MLYNSLEYAAFLSLAAIAYHLAPLGWRRAILLFASYGFYCTWSVPFAVLLLGVSGAAFAIGGRLHAQTDEAARLSTLRLGLAVLLLPLLAFKYLSGVDAATGGWLGGSTFGGAVIAQFAGAVGISYYTLKLISYLVDVYWQRLTPCRHFASLATYAGFFPQILSGPIQRAGDFLEQIEPLRRPRAAVVGSAFQLILFGLFKKLVLADRLGMVVDQVFAAPGRFSGAAVALAAYGFAIQLYADFSGLTDIAIGSARLFGLHSPPNFDAPFYAENIQDFWRRWHMTLTSWLGDYVFTPLRMALRNWGQTGLILSLTINMLAIGIWHGPRLTYVVFGLIHAAYLVGSSLTLRARAKRLRRSPLLSRAHRIVGPLITFNMVVVSFVFFRADSVATAWQVLRRATAGLCAPLLGLAAPHGVGIRGLDWTAADVPLMIFALVIMETIHVLKRRGQLSTVLRVTPGWARWAAYCTLGLAILLWGETGAKQFIYVRF